MAGAVAHLLIRGAGLLAIAWAVAILATLPDLGATRDAADRAAQGFAYSYEVMRARADRASDVSSCDPQHRLFANLLSVRAAEQSIESGALGEIDPGLLAADAEAGRLIACAPTQSFGWLARYWSERLRTGRGADAILEESYRTGRYESWLEARRSALVMPFYDTLPPTLRPVVMDEYIRLVERFQTDAAVAIFARLDDATRTLIAAQIKGSRRDGMGIFARRLVRAGYDLDLAGALGTPDRPWFR